VTSLKPPRETFPSFGPFFPSSKSQAAFVAKIDRAISCSTKERVISGLDGGKWLCHPRILLGNHQPGLEVEKEKDKDKEREREGRKCIVYSFGSYAQLGFELEINKMGPECEIHLFDPTPGIAGLLEKMQLPPQIIFHPGYGLGAEGVKTVKIRGKECPLKTLDQIAQELGHRELTILKIDIEWSEAKPRFVNLSSDSIWRRTANLQIEIHSAAWMVPLLEAFSFLGFELFHAEQNFLFPQLSEFSLINRALSSPILSIPYSPDHVAAARAASLQRVDEALSSGVDRGWGIPALETFAKVEPSYFGCRVEGRLPGQISKRICTSLLSDHRQELPPARAYVFDDRHFLSKAAFLSPLSQEFGIEIELFSPSLLDFFLSPFRPSHHHWLDPLTAGRGEARRLTRPISQIMRELKHDEVAMVIISLGNGVASMEQVLADQVLFELVRGFSRPLQLVFDISLCEDTGVGRREEDDRFDRMSALFRKARLLGLDLLEKSIDFERALGTPERSLMTRGVCDYTFTFVTE
jgi:hypothetical protein